VKIWIPLIYIFFLLNPKILIYFTINNNLLVVLSDYFSGVDGGVEQSQQTPPMLVLVLVLVHKLSNQSF